MSQSQSETQTESGGGSQYQSQTQSQWQSSGQHSFAAPEIDPASSIAALTLLVGSVLVMRGRRLVCLDSIKYLEHRSQDGDSGVWPDPSAKCESLERGVLFITIIRWHKSIHK
jgi:hypothetical protein